MNPEPQGHQLNLDHILDLEESGEVSELTLTRLRKESEKMFEEDDSVKSI